MAPNSVKNLICIEGMKGAGKSSTIQGVRDYLPQRGVSVVVMAPFAVANEHYEKQGGLYPQLLNAETCGEAFRFVLDVYQNFLDASSANNSFCILDRGWITLLCALEDSVMPELDKVRFKGQILNTIPPTVFLLASPALTLERRKGELDQKSGLYSTDLVTSDYERRLKLCARYSKDILLTFSVTEVELDARVQTICHMILAGREGPSAGLLDKNAEPLRDLATKR